MFFHKEMGMANVRKYKTFFLISEIQKFKISKSFFWNGGIEGFLGKSQRFRNSELQKFFLGMEGLRV